MVRMLTQIKVLTLLLNRTLAFFGGKVEGQQWRVLTNEMEMAPAPPRGFYLDGRQF